MRMKGPSDHPPAAAAFGGVLRLVLVALFLALLVRLLGVEGFRIPSASMEQSLLPGDLVLVSKVHYGPRLPRQVRVPLTDWTLGDASFPSRRLPGVTTVQRGDVVVFTRPLRGIEGGKRRYYIKRVIGLPGDTVQVREGRALVNGRLFPAPPDLQRQWVAQVQHPRVLPLDTLRRLGASQVARSGSHERLFEGTQVLATQLRQRAGVVAVVPSQEADSVAAYGSTYVPARGDTLHGDQLQRSPYRDLWQAAETTPLGTRRGAPQRWVVRDDQYFVLGDNRNSSVDSRVWGFVPASHIVGKAVVVYASWDPVERRPRWDRWLRPVR